MDVNRDEIRATLRAEFISTFLDELIPGILHNFANPLNGIMGRARLLERRLGAHVERMMTEHPEVAQQVSQDYQKIIKDINTINLEADKFYDMFRHTAEKFHSLEATGSTGFNLSRLLETEMRFADFYLDFKHEVIKEIVLDENVPDIGGDVADYSLCLSAIIRHAMEAMKGRADQRFYVSTGCRDGRVLLVIRFTAEARGQRGEKPVGGLASALTLLESYGARWEMDSPGETSTLTIRIPLLKERD
ncbi:MAG: hypothetical protein PHY31_00275 [Smithellaceae bacterium]|nr:hypothetical protein [Smithellaceae bacterium]